MDDVPHRTVGGKSGQGTHGDGKKDQEKLHAMSVSSEQNRAQGNSRSFQQCGNCMSGCLQKRIIRTKVCDSPGGPSRSRAPIRIK
jgi:hypothetical protein